VNASELTHTLRAAGLVTGRAPRLQPLPGGVSSDIVLVRDGSRRFVVKRALAKLKVRDDWFADPSRNGVERAYLEYAARVAPGAVPRVLAGDARAGWFAMEYFGAGHANWKHELLAGRARASPARRAGALLGKLHRSSWGDPVARARFATGRNFHALRVEPYLLTTAARVPAVRAILKTEAKRLAATALALVHGDFSPKNLLVTPRRVVLLDAEVAWFGDPAFDTAFLLTHLHLKALVHRRRPGPFLQLAAAFWTSYTAALAGHASKDLERRTVHLLLCLLLARVHGKSPAEYLTPPQRALVTAFAVRHLPRSPATLRSLAAAWQSAIVAG
jgi:aminoglycoside phosphotransferase (APT) family kinase protein